MKRNAFTLVEIMIVVVLLSILGGMVMAAVRAAGDSAKRSRTRSLIATIEDVLASKYESYKTRPLPVVVPDFSSNNEMSINVPPREAARVRLMMVRDLMRMELPDRMSDVLDNPMVIFAAAVPTVMQGDGQIVTGDPTPRRVNWYRQPTPPTPPNNFPAAQFSYRNRATSTWTRANESAECLYMIMATTFMDGVPAISSIPSSSVGDTDDDGMPEILDGWGNPIGFIRWPVGYIASDDVVPGLGLRDDFDPFRIDWSYVAGATDVPPAHPNSPDPSVGGQKTFALKPLIVSAGSDGEFGIRFGFGDPGDYRTDIRYSRMTWPVNDGQMGQDVEGRSSPYFYIDPYDRQRERGGVPPRPAVGETLNREQRADNIINYRLQETT